MGAMSETVFGGRRMAARFHGEPERAVLVRELPVRRYPDWLRASESEPELIEMATGLTAEEVDRLTPDSHAELALAAREVNDPFVERWLRRQHAAGTRLLGLTRELGTPGSGGSGGGSSGAR